MRAKWLGLKVEMACDEIAGAFGDERRCPAQHLVRDASERVQVGAVVHRTGATTLLRSHVRRSSDHGACPRVARLVDARSQLGDAEIEQLDPLAGGQVGVRNQEHVVMTMYAQRSSMKPKSNTSTIPGLRTAVAARASLKNRVTMSG